jgi:hypothetical protein
MVDSMLALRSRGDAKDEAQDRAVQLAQLRLRESKNAADDRRRKPKR